MRSLWLDNKGIVSEYMGVVIAVACVMVAILICNEFIFAIGNVAISLAPGQGASIMGFALAAWRLFPVICIIGCLAWALLKATQREGFETFE